MKTAVETCDACDRLTRMLGHAAHCGRHFTPSDVKGDGIKLSVETEQRVDPAPGQASLFTGATEPMEPHPGIQPPEPWPPPPPPSAPPPEPEPEPLPVVEPEPEPDTEQPPSDARKPPDPAAELVKPLDDGPDEGRRGQVQLFANEEIEWWRPHWKGMPEYEQDYLKPWKTLYVHFECREDLEAFSALVDQDIKADSTKSIWYPKQELNRVKDLRWIDASGDGDGIDEQYPVSEVDRDIMLQHMTEEIDL